MKPTAIVLFLLYFFIPSQLSFASTENNDYHLDIQNIDIGTPQSLLTPTPLLSKPIQKGFHYNIVLGSQADKAHQSFGLMLSNDTADFGEISPANPILRDTLVTIGKNPFYGYQLLIYQDHPLTTLDNLHSIPATTCDNGLCSETIATTWSNPLTYGFGYSCTNLWGSDCLVTFQGDNQFRQFPQNTLAQAQPVLSGIANTDKKSQINIKLNISQSQDIQRYINVTNYILISTY